MEKDVLEYFKKIEDRGGVIECIESGYLQKEIAGVAELNEKIDKNKRIIVGMNEYINEKEEITIPILKISNKVEEDQSKLINNLRKSRNNTKVKDKLRKN